MSIASHAFFLLFLPASLAVYWLGTRTEKVIPPARQKMVLLVGLSLAFYALSGWTNLLLLLGLSLATYWLARQRRFGLGIVLNLLALGVFKYTGFGANTLNATLQALNLPLALPVLRLALPLGISFYTFKHIGYLADVGSGRCPASQDPLAFLAYSFYFPVVSAGPLNAYSDAAAQFANLPARLAAEQVAQGLLQISVGLAKKVLVADVLRHALQTGFFNGPPEEAGLLWAWLSVLLFAFQLYFDFSGYTDLALGVSALFGIRLPANFNNPYLASNITEFWQRWHISLSGWFRSYLFFPFARRLLGQPIGQSAAQVLANLVTMTLIAWHGAG
jgi:D-alanyl-lipoteichoic acid acyltransferase DltB (MBOAT superfamily)